MCKLKKAERFSKGIFGDKISVDNPGGDWLKFEQERVSKRENLWL